MKKFSAALFFFFIIIASTHPQEVRWSLEDCMKYAIKNSPAKNRQEAQNSIYHQDYLEAIGRLLPSVDASTKAYFNFGRGLNEDNTYSDINSFSNNYELYSSLVLFDGLANINKLKMQKINKLKGKEELAEIEDKIAYETMEAYFNVIYYKQMIDLAEYQLRQSSDNLNQVKRMEELGVKGIPDVAEMQAKEATDRYNITRQSNLLTIAILRLKEKMNFPIEGNLDIGIDISDELIVKANESAIDIFHQSMTYLPKALAAEATLKAQQLAYRVAKGSIYPTISVNAGYSTNFYRVMDGSQYTSFNTQLKDKVGHYIGFTLRIPVFNGFSRSAQVKKGKAQLIISQSDHEESMRVIYSEIEQAVADMNGQVDEYYQAKKQVEAIGIAHQINQRKYKEGLISALELHTSSNRLFESEIVELNAQLKYYLKRRLVNYYKGESFIK